MLQAHAMTNTRLTRAELIQRLTIKMAATHRNPPILRGKAAPRDAREGDAFRTAFAEWFVDECIEKNGLVVLNTYVTLTGDHMRPFMNEPRGTPPQRFAR